MIAFRARYILLALMGSGARYTLLASGARYTLLASGARYTLLASGARYSLLVSGAKYMLLWRPQCHRVRYTLWPKVQWVKERK